MFEHRRLIHYRRFRVVLDHRRKVRTLRRREPRSSRLMRTRATAMPRGRSALVRLVFMKETRQRDTDSNEDQRKNDEEQCENIETNFSPPRTIWTVTSTCAEPMTTTNTIDIDGNVEHNSSTRVVQRLVIFATGRLFPNNFVITDRVRRVYVQHICPCLS